MEQIVLEAKKRAEKGKTLAKGVRAGGFIPAVIYGKKLETIPVSVAVAALERALHHGAAHKVVNLKIESGQSREEKMCVIQQIQKDPLGNHILHVDFHHISMDEKITSKIPVELSGQPSGAKEGGVLDHVLWEVEVEALPMNLPEKILADVSGLAINNSLHVKDLKFPEGVAVLDDPEEVVAIVHPPRAEEVVAPAAVPVEAGAAVPAAAAQPEVISKGKKEEEEVPEEKPKK